MMPTLNYTTTKTVDGTIGEITKMLASRGVASISTTFSENGTADGLGFSLRTPHGPRQFALHVNVDGVHALLSSDPKVRKRGPQYVLRPHAERVAWRVVRDWLEAQLALIDADMATLDQVMLPYLVTDASGLTLYERYVEREQAALTP
jgi:hypothetical protein